VYVHQTLHAANQRSLKRGGRVMAITPRHFLDFINHFVKLYAEKRSALVSPIFFFFFLSFFCYGPQQFLFTFATSLGRPLTGPQIISPQIDDVLK
jgi:hypothetical protein